MTNTKKLNFFQKIGNALKDYWENHDAWAAAGYDEVVSGRELDRNNAERNALRQKLKEEEMVADALKKGAATKVNTEGVVIDVLNKVKARPVPTEDVMPATPPASPEPELTEDEIDDLATTLTPDSQKSEDTEPPTQPV